MKNKLAAFFLGMMVVSCWLLGQGALSFAEQNDVNEDVFMQINAVVDKPAMIVVGIACRTSNTPEGAPQDIPKLWGRLYSEGVLERIPNKASNEVIALYCDYEGDYTKPYTCVIGCVVSSLDSIPEGMVAKVLPATSYVLFNAVGEHPKAVIDTWGKVWQTDLPRTYTGDFEVYGEKFAALPQEVEVYVAVSRE